MTFFYSPAGSRGGVQLVFVPAWSTFSSSMVHFQFMLPDCVLDLVCCLVSGAAWWWVLPRPQAFSPWLPSWLLAAAGRWLFLMGIGHLGQFVSNAAWCLVLRAAWL